MNNLIKYNSDKMSLHEHKIVSSIENNGINLTNLIFAMNENLVCGLSVFTGSRSARLGISIIEY